MPKPRTKRTNARKMDPTVKKQLLSQLRNKLGLLQTEFENDIEEIKLCGKNVLEQMRGYTLNEQQFAEEDLNKLISESALETTNKSILYALSSTKKLNSIMEQSLSTRKTHKNADTIRKPLSTRNKQSDEGYLTAESTRSRSIERTNMHTSTLKTALKSKRKSRSLSRTKMPKNVQLQLPEPESDQENKDCYTPEKRMPPPNSYYITPKVKPNNPVTVLRRPVAGEMAVSMKGSPLFVSGIVTESTANVNIPLKGGKVMSIQPCKNIRVSQIPEINKETREQLQRLRDHLNIVCSLATHED